MEVTPKKASPLLEWTGERYLPWLEEPAIGYEHIHRYAYATQFVQNKRVLDLACGEGYGSYLLAKTAQSVLGIDIDENSIKHARNKYIKQNLEFKVGSITEVPIGGESLFDVAVCFEALEHIEDHEKLLSEVKRLLTPDGVFIVSTPNKTVYTDEPQFNNPFHVHELYFDEFRELFEKYFKNVKFLGQRIWCDSNIWPVFSTGESKFVEYVIDRNPKEFVFVEKDKRIPLYFIAIASDADGDIEERRSALIDVSDAFLKQKDEQIAAHVRKQEPLAEEEVKQLLAERERFAQEAGRLQTVLQAQHQVMAEKEEGSKQLLAERDRLAQEAGQLRAMVDGQQQVLRQREQQILQLTGQRGVLAAKMAAQATGQQQVLRQREQQILQLTGQREVLAAKMAAQANHLQGVLEAQQEDLQGVLKAQQQELVAIKGSLAWLCIIKYRSARDKLFPPETHRRNGYERSKDFLKDLAQLGAGGLLQKAWNKTKDEQSSNGPGTHPGTTATEQPTVATSVGNQNQSEFLRSPGETWKTELDAFLSDPTRHLIFPLFETPLVSVVIPTFNKVEYLYQCLNSIFSHTEVPYELIVVDDCSQDLTAQLLNKIQNIHIERNEQNLDFIRTCNKGASFARGRYIMFLNNDVVVTPGWLSVLTSTIEQIPDCGAVGAKLVRPDGKLQEAGSIVWQDGSAMGYGRDDDPLKPEYCYLREVDYCSAACLLVRAELFRELKGFDERYLPAYYEDADLCLGIRDRGYKVIYQPQATVFHHEFGSRSFERAKALMEVNRKNLIQKWAGGLSQQYPYGNILKARNRRSERPILVIDDQVPAPYLGSGFPRAYKLIEFLCELNFAVTFIPVSNSTAHQPATERLQQRGVEVFYGNSFVLEALVRSRAGHYETVIVSRPHNGAKYLSLVRECFPNAHVIYDAEAVFCLREFLRAEVEGRSLGEAQKRKMLRDELDIMRQANLVMTVSEVEREVILREKSHDNVVVWGHPHELHNPDTPFSERKDLLFVGGFTGGHPPNTDAVCYFVTTLLPKISQKLPGCRVIVVGSEPPESVKTLASEQVIITGFVENLEEYYEKCRVFIAPTRFTAGISLKLVEAMSYGIPTVVSTIAASGLNLRDGQEALIAANDEDFINKVVYLYGNETLWCEIQQTAQNYVWEHCSPEAMKNKLAATLDFDKELSQPESETNIERHENKLPPVTVDEEIPVPPLDMIDLVVGTRDVEGFIQGGKNIAHQGIVNALKRNNLDLNNFQAILDFGCGCGRLMRHWKYLTTPRLYGSDYNSVLIDWCKNNLRFAKFQVNSLEPPLNYSSGQFDFIFCGSVFTHFHEALQFAWLDELWRVLMMNGYLMITVHGEYYAQKLPPELHANFCAGEYVAINQEQAGQNTCGAYHSAKYIREKVARRFTLIDHIPMGWDTQDIVVLQKRIL